nr:hypothetical protein BaRGS_023476 [Batillaria attramentaria]
MLHSLFSKIWEKEEVPAQWKEGIVIKLPKKGDLRDCSNYRGIMLLSVPGKIASLRIIVEQSLEWNSPLYINFIDYEKAFDSVDREALWKLLRHYGVPGKIISLIQCTYQDMSCRIAHAGQLSESFEVKTGVRQGCLLSPFLFLLVIDWIMKTTTAGRKNGIQWSLWTQLDDLDFADDLALLSHSHSQMQDKTTCLEATSAGTGLKINRKKTELMKINTTASTPSQSIWKEYHSKKDCVFAVLKFVFPLPRNDGFEFMLMQFDGKDVQFTSLAMYQILKENAPACMSLTHYTELVDSKGIVLMSGQYDDKVLKREEALMVVQLMTIYYGKNTPRFDRVYEFNHKPDSFDYNVLIDDCKNLYANKAE